MSCRSTPYGSAYTTIARLQSGLNDVQTLSLFHALRREFTQADGVPPVTEERWHQYLDATRERITGDESLSDARRRSILSRLDRSREVTPDDASFAAIVVMDGRAQAQAVAVSDAIRDVAAQSGETEADVRARYQQYADEVDHARGAAAPAHYTDDTVAAARRAGLPIDRGSVSALGRLRAEAAAAPQSAPPRITRQPFESAAISEAGYDPRGGRLEVVMNSNPDHVYMYRNVPPDVWERMQSGSAGGTFARQVRGNRMFQYATREEAEAAGRAPRCSSCGQFSAVGHTCPAVAETPAAPVAEAPAARARRRVQETAPAVAETASEPEAAPEPAPEPEPEPTPEPEPRPVVTLRRGWRRSRTRFSAAARSGIPQAEAADNWLAPSVTEIRAEARENQVEYPFSWSGYRGLWDTNTRQHREPGSNAFGRGYFTVQGTAEVRREGREWHINTRDLRCHCAEYQANYDCEHVRAAVGALRATIVPPARGGATAVDAEAAQREAEIAARADWSRTETGLAEAQRSWAVQSDESANYSTNFQAFENDIKIAEERVRGGEHAIEFQRENAMGGWCAEGSDEGFGVELEFVLPDGNRYNALRAIGADLHAAGLTPSANQQRYHSDPSVYRQHQGGWKFEQDCTVDGEIISPVMQDTPETWENIAKVCEIVKRHGGKASPKTGSHVHVSSPRMSGAAAANLLHTVNQHEDVIYRMSMNPESAKHRNMTWCGPNREIVDGVTELTDVRRAAFGHNSGLNLQHVSGSSGDHPEIRHWDGTLDPAVIQAQAKMSVGLVKAAQRNANTPATRRKEPVGSHHKRLLAVRGRSRRKLTSEELREDSATARSLIDTLFHRSEDKAQMAALFSITKWNS